MDREEFAAQLLLRGFEPSSAPFNAFHIVVATLNTTFANEYVSVYLLNTSIKINSSDGPAYYSEPASALKAVDTLIKGKK